MILGIFSKLGRRTARRENMSSDVRRILSMLEEKKISVEEAEKLLAALGGEQNAPVDTLRKPPRYFRVQVQEDKGDNVNIRIPLQVVRAGMKLTSLIPESARHAINEKLKQNKIPLDIDSVKPDNVDDFLTSLAELEISVDEGEGGDKVRIFCE
jgi:predicted hydrocarbon binding protein